MLGFLWAIIVGFVAGTLAKLIMPGRDPGGFPAGFIVTILLGIGGSILATWLGRTLGWYHGDQHARFIGSVVGAVIILGIYRIYVRQRYGGSSGPSLT
jgi:uncharacterized membrane protein YeaQ/YmgE (transglycosylase-associated protein family)